MLKKKDGSNRFCADYRLLNRHMPKQIFPMPNIEEQLQDASRFEIFTALDLNSGYYQIPIAPDSRKYTAFVTTDGIYEFKPMPFGLKNAPIASLTKVKDLTKINDMVHYMNDILIEANTSDYLLKRKEFSSRYEKLLTPDGIRPGKIKTAAVNDFRQPIKVTEVRRFLGLSGYFRKFVPSYAIISDPILKLLKKYENFHWGSSQEQAFNELKSALTKMPALCSYDPNAEHQIHTDASSIGLAGALMQRIDDS